MRGVDWIQQVRHDRSAAPRKESLYMSGACRPLDGCARAHRLRTRHARMSAQRHATRNYAEPSSSAATGWAQSSRVTAGSMAHRNRTILCDGRCARRHSGRRCTHMTAVICSQRTCIVDRSNRERAVGSVGILCYSLMWGRPLCSTVCCRRIRRLHSGVLCEAAALAATACACCGPRAALRLACGRVRRIACSLHRRRQDGTQRFRCRVAALRRIQVRAERARRILGGWSRPCWRTPQIVVCCFRRTGLP